MRAARSRYTWSGAPSGSARSSRSSWFRPGTDPRTCPAHATASRMCVAAARVPRHQQKLSQESGCAVNDPGQLVKSEGSTHGTGQKIHDLPRCSRVATKIRSEIATAGCVNRLAVKFAASIRVRKVLWRPGLHRLTDLSHGSGTRDRHHVVQHRDYSSSRSIRRSIMGDLPMFPVHTISTEKGVLSDRRCRQAFAS